MKGAAAWLIPAVLAAAAALAGPPPVQREAQAWAESRAGDGSRPADRFHATTTRGSGRKPVPRQRIDDVTFIACPVYRDTDAGPKSGCWLATDPASGIRYDVSGALTKPMRGREALIEGRPGDASAACGGRRLRPVHVSVLSTRCAGHMLPAEGFPGNRFGLPAEVMQPTDVPRAVPTPPFDVRRFSIWFDFDSDFLRYQYSELILEKAAILAAASQANVTVTGFADTAGVVVTGRHLAEDRALARRRAERVAEALRRLGVAAGRIDVAWRGDPDPRPEGDLAAPSLRRVEILVEP